MLSQQLIENALALCGKTMGDMYEITTYENMNEEQGGYNTIIENSFSIKNFGWYLLSPEFIKKYEEKYCIYPDGINRITLLSREIGEIINTYQSGNEQPLIELLTKICKNN